MFQFLIFLPVCLNIYETFCAIQREFSFYELFSVFAGACIQSTNGKIIKLVHTFLNKLMSIFPVEGTGSNVACKYEELDVLYATTEKV